MEKMKFEESLTFEDLRRRIEKFANDRDWEKYHTPRNLTLALVGEVGELSECFQWKGEVSYGLPELTEQEKEHVGEEMSDVLIYLIRLADRCKIDLPTAALSKIEKNAIKYPVPDKNSRTQTPTLEQTTYLGQPSPPYLGQLPPPYLGQPSPSYLGQTSPSYSTLSFLPEYCSTAVQLNNLNHIATKIGDGGYNDGEVFITQPQIDRDGKMSFRVRYVGEGWAWIGWAPLSNLNGTNCVRSGFFFYSPNSILHGKDNWGGNYGDPHKILLNQLIESVLDPQAGTISFTLNGQDLGIAYSNVQEPEKLHPALVLQHEGSSWSLE